MPKRGMGQTVCHTSCACFLLRSLPGYGGTSCQICPSGQFSPGGPAATTECQQCPVGSSNPPGATSCGYCFPGFGGPSCLVCLKGTWSPGGTDVNWYVNLLVQQLPSDCSSLLSCVCSSTPHAGSLGMRMHVAVNSCSTPCLVHVAALVRPTAHELISRPCWVPDRNSTMGSIPE